MTAGRRLGEHLRALHLVIAYACTGEGISGVNARTARQASDLRKCRILDSEAGEK